MYDSLIKEIQWNSEWFKKRPQQYWKSFANQRRFLDEYAIQNGIMHPRFYSNGYFDNISDWGKITLKEFCKKGSSIVNLHNLSMIKMLKSVYPGFSFYLNNTVDIAWKMKWFANLPRVTKGYWNNPVNQRNYFSKIMEYYLLDSPFAIGKSLIKSNGAWVCTVVVYC